MKGETFFVLDWIFVWNHCDLSGVESVTICPGLGNALSLPQSPPPAVLPCLPPCFAWLKPIRLRSLTTQQITKYTANVENICSTTQIIVGEFENLYWITFLKNVIQGSCKPIPLRHFWVCVPLQPQNLHIFPMKKAK